MLRSVRHLFCSRLFTAAKPLLVAEGADLQAVRGIRPLEPLGFVPDQCTRVPNAVFDYSRKRWLILLEIAECHGPIDSEHRDALLASFASVKGRDLLLVTAFADRAQFARYQAVIAWGTSAWIAKEPDHLVVFGGQCLVGPEPDTNFRRRRAI